MRELTRRLTLVPRYKKTNEAIQSSFWSKGQVDRALERAIKPYLVQIQRAICGSQLVPSKMVRLIGIVKPHEFFSVLFGCYDCLPDHTSFKLLHYSSNGSTVLRKCQIECWLFWICKLMNAVISRLSKIYETLHWCAGAKAFIWLDRMLHHRADPTNEMIIGDNSQTRSPWGVQVKQLTKICWYLIAPTSTQTYRAMQEKPLP